MLPSKTRVTPAPSYDKFPFLIHVHQPLCMITGWMGALEVAALKHDSNSDEIGSSEASYIHTPSFDVPINVLIK